MAAIGTGNAVGIADCLAEVIVGGKDVLRGMAERGAVVDELEIVARVPKHAPVAKGAVSFPSRIFLHISIFFLKKDLRKDLIVLAAQSRWANAVLWLMAVGWIGVGMHWHNIV